jgi:endonuclease V-like protein UPF0215 family
MRALQHCRFIRAVGFDDGPFSRVRVGAVPLVGAVCSGTRFEGMVFGRIRKDGWNATGEIVRLLEGGKFLPQVHLVLLDGIAFGGFNVVDLDALARRLGRPCVAVMRRPPDLAAIQRAVSHLASARRRFEWMQRAGPIHQRQGFVFQVAGGEPDEVGDALVRITDTGRVPEALRLAHLIGSAVVTGESGRRA